MDDEPIIRVENLIYNIPKIDKRILNGINFTVNKNEIVSIVGRLGSGKSILLKLLIGILKPQNGDVIINGKSLKEEKSDTFFTEVGLLFENPEDQLFYPVVIDDIAFGPHNMGLSSEEIQKRVINACKEVQILHLMERDTASLSFGEKTLVALAGILAMEPQIILMDSPEIGLDLWTKTDVLKTILGLKKKHTIIITTNDIDMLKISDKILLLYDRKIRGEYRSFKQFKKELAK